MQSETGFPNSHQLNSYVASKSRLKLAARAVLSADAGLLVNLLDFEVLCPAGATRCTDSGEIWHFLHAKFHPTGATARV